MGTGSKLSPTQERLYRKVQQFMLVTQGYPVLTKNDISIEAPDGTKFDLTELDELTALECIKKFDNKLVEWAASNVAAAPEEWVKLMENQNDTNERAVAVVEKQRTIIKKHKGWQMFWAMLACGLLLGMIL